VREQASALGYDVRVADTPAAVRDALAANAGLLVLDLHVSGIDWRETVAAAKERAVPILAFGRHTEAALLREARELGCDRVVPRSQLVEELNVMLSEAKHLAPRDAL
jgi:CheY-like chemotaxis protein